jgi:hypothetical protein
MKKAILGFAALLVFAVAAHAQLVINGARAFPQANDGTTGTTINLLAAVNSSANAIKATTANTTVPTYIVVGGAGTTGNAALAMSGLASCVMDTTIASAAGGDFVVASTTTAGDCHPQSASPTSGTYVVGHLVAGSTTATSAALVKVSGYFFGSGSSSGGAMVFSTALDQTIAGNSNVCSATGNVNQCNRMVFPNARTLIRLTLNLNGAPAGCTTQPQFGLTDLTTSTILASITIANGATTGFADSGSLSVAMTAGDEFGVGLVVTGVGCTTQAQIANVNASIQ